MGFLLDEDIGMELLSAISLLRMTSSHKNNGRANG